MKIYAGKIGVSDEVSSRAREVANAVEPSQLVSLENLISNARQGIRGTRADWAPFNALLLEDKVPLNRDDQGHLAALLTATMGRALALEREDQAVAVAASEARAAAATAAGRR